MRSTTFRVATVAVALSGLAAAAFTSHSFFLVLAFVALFVLATSFGEAGRLIEPLQAFLHRSAEVHVWGAPLPVPSHATITITSVKALSAGLHMFLQVGPNASSIHLKVAQPSRAQVLPQRLTIESAAYVQWAGKRLPRVAGAPALTISLPVSSVGQPPGDVA